MTFVPFRILGYGGEGRLHSEKRRKTAGAFLAAFLTLFQFLPTFSHQLVYRYFIKAASKTFGTHQKQTQEIGKPNMKSRSRSVVSVGEKSQDGDCSTPDLDLPRLHAFSISTLDIQSRMIRDEESLSRTTGMSSSTLHLALPDLLGNACKSLGRCRESLERFGR